MGGAWCVGRLRCSGHRCTRWARVRERVRVAGESRAVQGDLYPDIIRVWREAIAKVALQSCVAREEGLAPVRGGHGPEPSASLANLQFGGPISRNRATIRVGNTRRPIDATLRGTIGRYLNNFNVAQARCGRWRWSPGRWYVRMGGFRRRSWLRGLSRNRLRRSRAGWRGCGGGGRGINWRHALGGCGASRHPCPSSG